ncbi:MAG: NADPH-dependent glutamate synthase [Candidatus Omnitrophica bacterium]|nr:NADPH-dependent glutamate synthase [Candidatus Omnitrophota bacterium]MDD5236758.1 NADPH-dependent glutamate synthase [Candidatus Omnitrophota bacterium]MDD5610061.1 NADPH-dependent glutamate synthase [Candidatus Omnitrophota bacterium]
MKKNPVKALEVEAAKRVENFGEVVSGYNEQDALSEASRCLQCKNPACTSGCPVGIDIKKFIYQITQKDYAQAYFTIREKNNFPSLCGRICPAEYQCRKACVLTKKGQPYASSESININFLERFVGDYGMKNNLEVPVNKDTRLSKFKVAVVGSGPAGLCCAGELARNGIGVVVLEGLHKTGGVLRYGIPPFRLPRDILDFEINYLKKLGVEFITNFIVGKARTLDELFSEKYSAVFLGLGAGIPSFLGIPGENLCNIYSANEFLTRVNLMSAFEFPHAHTPVSIGKHVVVIGGGNTAMDAARVALRLQKINSVPADTTVVYRRTEVEMPARRLEIEHAREEGIKFEFLVKPEGFCGDEASLVRRLTASRCELGEPDASGRRRPVEIPNSGFATDCDLAVVAIGLKANSILTNVTPGLKTDKYGDVVVDKETMETSLKNVFAGGDIVGGEGTVIEAMGMAKSAARSIVNRLLQR